MHRAKAFLALTLLLFSVACEAQKEVRYDPTPYPVVRAMLQLAKVGPNDVIYDLGSGDGRIVITAAREFGARGVGVDIDPALIAQARANARAAGVEDKVRFIEGNMYDADVREASVVSVFLHPEPNMKLRPKLLSQLKPGSRIVSYIWDMGDWKPDAEQSAGVRDYNIYLWRVPAEQRESARTK
jgi:SAM-dependent methyltransferase